MLSMRYDLILAKCVGTVLALESTPVHLSYIIIFWFSNLGNSRRVNDWEPFFEEVEIEGLLRLLLLKSLQDLKNNICHICVQCCKIAILVRAALCRRCLTAVGHYFAYFSFSSSCFLLVRVSMIRRLAYQTMVPL
jgi:hypothetical protein